MLDLDSDQLNLSPSMPPVYYIHSFERPFCNNPLCLCQLRQKETVKLFVGLVEGKLELAKADTLLSERTV